MTRKQGQSRTETYDLSKSRNVAAFEALIEADDDTEDPQQLPPRGKRGQQQQKREKEKFFKLKANLSQAQGVAATAVSDRQQLQQLLDMFQGSCEAGVVTDVYRGAGNNLEAAVETLLSMLGASQPDTISADQPSSSWAAEHAASSSSADQSGGNLPWRDLASDVKTTILSHLPLKDLARLAHTSKEFHERASTMRRQVQHLVIQPGLGYSAIEGMVRSHGAAAVVDLSKLEKHISRQDPEQLAPQVVAMHKQEAEANLWKAVLAVSAGDSGAGSREQPVKGLVLKGLVGATDRVLAEALQSLKGLRSLDLSHCPLLTNKSLYALAKYKASEGVGQRQQQPHATTTDATADDPSAEALSNDYGFGTDEEWEQWPKSEDGVDNGVDGGDAADAGADGVDAAPDDDDRVDSSTSSNSQAQAGDGNPAAVAEDTVADAADIAAQIAALATPGPAVPSAAERNSDIANLSNLNPAIHDPVTTALSTAVTNRLASVQLQAQQQAAAAAASAAAAAANPVGLQELRLAGSSSWADDGLRQLLQGPVTKHSLSKLDISGCKGITTAGLIIPPLGVLRNLKACRLPGLKQLVVQLPASHPLATLDLSNCHFLRKVDLHLNHLQQLNLAACRTLYRLRMRCPSLRTLNLSQCGTLHEFHTDAWQVPALQSLNMFGCRRASGQMLQAVLDELLELRQIDLNGCWAISRLHLLGNPQLESIDLTGCRNLMSFSSSSTALTELEAASCSRLYSLTLASSNLITLQLQNCAQLAEVYVPALVGSSSGAKQDSTNSRAKSATGKGLSVNGCSALSADAKVRLAMSVSAL